MSIGKRLRELRLDRGISQAALAEIAGCSAQHIGDIELNDKVCSVKVVRLSADYFGVTTDYLILGKKSA